MICVEHPCDNCVHRKPNKDGWKAVCDAFPDGMPREIIMGNPEKLSQCNNGIGYEPK